MSSSKFCTGCGTVAGNERFCTSCGATLDPDAEQAAPASPEHQQVEAREGVGHANVAPGGASSNGSSGSGPASATAVREEQLGSAAETLVPLPAAAHAGPPAMAPSEKRRIPWLPIGLSSAAIVGLCAAAAVVLILTGGEPVARAHNPQAEAVQLTDSLLANRQLYVATQQASYSALLPAGWQQVATRASGLTGAVTVQSPVNQGATITVGQLSQPGKTLASAGAKVLKAASARPAFKEQSSAAVTLAGGRHGWAVAYQANGASDAYYLVQSCNTTYAIAATVPPASVALLRTRIMVVAETLQGGC
jgi:hypothetical protein